MQQLQSLRRYFHLQAGDARQITLGSGQIAHQSNSYRVSTRPEDDRNARGRGLCSLCGQDVDGRNDGGLTLNEIGRKRRQSVGVAVGQASVDADVSSVNIASFV